MESHKSKIDFSCLFALHSPFPYYLLKRLSLNIFYCKGNLFVMQWNRICFAANQLYNVRKRFWSETTWHQSNNCARFIRYCLWMKTDCSKDLCRWTKPNEIHRTRFFFTGSPFENFVTNMETHFLRISCFFCSSDVGSPICEKIVIAWR